MLSRAAVDGVLDLRQDLVADAVPGKIILCIRPVHAPGNALFLKKRLDLFPLREQKRPDQKALFRPLQ